MRTRVRSAVHGTVRGVSCSAGMLQRICALSLSSSLSPAERQSAHSLHTRAPACGTAVPLLLRRGDVALERAPLFGSAWSDSRTWRQPVLPGRRPPEPVHSTTNGAARDATATRSRRWAVGSTCSRVRCRVCQVACACTCGSLFLAACACLGCCIGGECGGVAGRAVVR